MHWIIAGTLTTGLHKLVLGHLCVGPVFHCPALIQTREEENGGMGRCWQKEVGRARGVWVDGMIGGGRRGQDLQSLVLPDPELTTSHGIS